MTLELLEDEFSIYKVDPNHVVNEKLLSSKFISITKTEDEISIVAPKNEIHNFIKSENDWKVLKICGMLDFSLVGILHKISAILANENISIFVISTYNTDYIMVKKDNLEKAIKVLVKNHYEVKH